MTSETRVSAAKAAASRPLRLSLSITDILLLIVMVALVASHVQDVASGKLLSALFVLQQVTVILFVLLHRPPQSRPAPWQDVLLA